MIMTYPNGGCGGGATTISSGVTTVDCEKQVRSWRLLRSIMELLIPSCNCTFIEEDEIKQKKFMQHNYYFKHPSFNSSSSPITCTIYGFRRGKVSLCIQANPKSTNSILLLELSVTTVFLAREMRGGLLRIALECSYTTENIGDQSGSLLSMPLWTMYCNGRKSGFAMKRQPSNADLEVLKKMESVVVGAGTLNGKELGRHDDIMYLRGKFQRVHGSCDTESFHLFDPEGNIGQELSVFFLRSR